jgi:hypothetical protein
LTIEVTDPGTREAEPSGAGPAVARSSRARSLIADADVRRYVITMAAFGAVAALWYVLVLWDFGFAPFRTAVWDGALSNFYDIQARALLDGQLELPPGSLGIEAFVIDGRYFMYFPPGPSLLRMPLFLLTDRFDGRLTAPSMLAAWVTTTVLVSLLLWRVRRVLRGDAPLGRGEAASYGILLVSITAGSVLLFLASMPWVYHEAYAWAVPMSIGFSHSLLGVIQKPTTGRLLAASAFTLGAVLSRTTAGWACAGALVLTGLWFLLGRRGPEARAIWWRLLPAGLVPLAIGAAVNFAKFSHPYMFPLEDQVWTEISQQRRAALAANGGDLVSADIFFSTVVNYFRPDGIRFVPVFPYIALPADVAQSYGGGFLDQTYRTGSVPTFMPLLFLLALYGGVTVFRRGAPPGAVLLRLPMFGAGVIIGGIMFYGYIAYRYTTEFLPVLVLASAAGLVELSRRLADVDRRVRVGALGAMVALTAFGVAANTATAVTTQRTENPGPLLRDYVVVREKLSARTGHPNDGFVSTGHRLPTYGPADELRIIDDCRSWYLGTGDPISPWVVIEAVEVRWEGTILDDRRLDREGEIQLAHFTGYRRVPLVLDRFGPRAYRLRLGLTVIGTWHAGRRGEPFMVSVRPDTRRDRFVLQGPGVVATDVPMTQLGPDWVRKPVLVEPLLEGTVRTEGVELTLVEQPELPWCERILARQD